MDIAELGLVIRSDGVVVAKNRLRDFENQAGLTEKRAAAMGAVVGKALGVIGAALSVREIVNYADAWSDMQSRVGAAIKDMEAAPQMMQRMVDLANASYSPLNQTVETFARNVGVLRDLGYSANEAADFTEGLNHALVVTATRGERAASVQNALAKAMAVGKLQADGLETVLANGGRVAEALAAELDTTVSGLRAMSSAGRITGDVIARALTGRLQELRDEAAEMPATIADAFTRVQTNLTALIGTMDKTTGASAAVAGGIMALADNMDMLVPIAGGVATVLTVAMIPAITSATASFGALTLAMLANPFVQVALVAGTLAGALIYLHQQQGLAAQAAQTHAEALTTNANAIETAKTSSQGFRDGLRSQIELQVAAARAALDEAGAQYKAAEVKARAANMFNAIMSAGSMILGGEGENRNYGAGVMGNALEEINTAYGRLQELEGQLAMLGEVETTYKPIEHTVAGLNSIGEAATAATGNIKSIADNGFAHVEQRTNWFAQAATNAFSNMGTGLINAFKQGGDVGMNVLNMLLDKVGQLGENLLNQGLNGLFSGLMGGLFGGHSLGGGWGVAGGFAGFPGIFGIPGMADGGTVARSGLSWVGERGPELLRLPAGAQVIPNGPSMAMAANDSGGDLVIHNHISVPAGTSPDMAPALAREITKELRRQLPDALERHNRNPLRRAG